MNDDTLIRLENLRALEKRPVDLAEEVGGSKQYWGDLLRGKKSFGERIARKIEEKLGLPRGALDQYSDTGHTESAGSVHDSGVTNITTLTEQPPQDGKMSDRQSNLTKEIPTTMMYAPDHLRDAILLMGSLLGALDGRSRKTIGGVLKDLANAPDEASYFASIAVTAAKEQAPITTNEELERALHPARKTKEKV